MDSRELLGRKIIKKRRPTKGIPNTNTNNTMSKAKRSDSGHNLVKCKDNVTICHGDTACATFENGTYYCVCTHTNTPKIFNEKCKRITIEGGVGTDAIMLPHIDQFSTQNQTTKPVGVGGIGGRRLGVDSSGDDIDNGSEIGNNGTGVWLGDPSWVTLTLALIIGIILSSLLAMAYIKRKPLKRILNRQHSKMELKAMASNNGRLLPDRYIMNPTYETAVVDILQDSTVRIFSPSEINILAQIGQGCFGKVYKGELNGESVAIKQVKNECSLEAMKEVDAMEGFAHKNILQMIGIVKNNEMEAPWLVFEYMEYGDLASVLRVKGETRNFFAQSAVPSSSTLNKEEKENEKKLENLHLTKDSLVNISYQIAEGMKYLSSQHFVHRDLAARNCLIGSMPTKQDSENDNFVVKISDFGLSRDVYTCDYYKIGGSRLLPIRWMSPESVVYGKYTLESDIWSYSVLLWEIFSWGKQPYYGHHNGEVIQIILDGILLLPPSDCPPFICEIMAKCWKTDPKDRIKFPEICEKLQKHLKKGKNEMREDSESDSLQLQLDEEPESDFPLQPLQQRRTKEKEKDGEDDREEVSYSFTGESGDEKRNWSGYEIPKHLKKPVDYMQVV